MKLVVAIPTYGRPGQTRLLLDHLTRQSRLPDEVVISAPDASHVGELGDYAFPVTAVYGEPGLTRQRNAALDYALSRFDVITFFDDDFIPADNYLELVADAFAGHDNWAVLMGRVVKDGAPNAGLDWDAGLEALQEAAAAATPSATALVIDHVGAYGCNMSIRTAMIGTLRFDERLVLYGWQEDIDFTSQLRMAGRVVCLTTILGVHLGIKSGRVSGTRFGYSQIANPAYLIRKGSVPASFALRMMARNLSANIVRSLWPESYVDRRGRLRGNLLALVHLFRGRIQPEYILQL